ncbi:MAG: hypothetical protein U0271_13435 [Polyangiaceae bacterium]
MRSAHWLAAGSLIAGAGLASGVARADDGEHGEGSNDGALVVSSVDESLDPTAPPTLPSLTHKDASLEFTFTAADIGSGAATDTVASITRVDTEIPLGTRAWQMGFAWDLVTTTAPFGRVFSYGNPEVWFRGVGWHESGLSAGGGLGVVVPLPRDLSQNEEAVLDVIRVIRPWDTGYFMSNVFALRPVIDARLVISPVVLQLRQGLDLTYQFDTGRSDIVGRIGTYAGVDATDFMTFGLELWQIYSITADVRDSRRASFSMSPSIRLRLGPVQPALSVMFPLTTPLEGIASQYFAVRLQLRLALGRTARLPLEP